MLFITKITLTLSKIIKLILQTLICFRVRNEMKELMKTSSLPHFAALYLELVDNAADEIHGVLNRVLAPVIARRGGGGAEARAESGLAVNIRRLRNLHSRLLRGLLLTKSPIFLDFLTPSP